MNSVIPAFDFHRVVVEPWTENFQSYGWILLMGFLVTTACGQSGNPPGAAGGGFPPTAVQVLAAAETAIDDSSEYVAGGDHELRGDDVFAHRPNMAPGRN